MRLLNRSAGRISRHRRGPLAGLVLLLLGLVLSGGLYAALAPAQAQEQKTDEELVDDTMFSEVAWSWLTDALAETGAEHTTVGGTVTRTASTRFGELAGPEHSVDVEMRASWTAGDTALDQHLMAWLQVLANAAGLPPPGVHLLGESGRGADRSGGDTL